MEYTIAPMLRAHLEQVEAIERACFTDPWSGRLLREMLEAENTVSLAALTPDGTVLGYISFSFVLDEGGVNNLAVRPDCRRQGVASALLRQAERLAREKGLAFLILEVRPSNLEAVALYGKHGYAQAGRRKNYYLHPREDAIYMKLELLP